MRWSDLDYIYGRLKDAGLEPIFNYFSDPHPNCGTVVRTNEATRQGNSNIRIGDWRVDNPLFTVSLAYGVSCSADGNLKLLGGGHGTMLHFSSLDFSRFYWWNCGNVNLDQLLMPNRILLDILLKSENKRCCYIHYPDLKWFDPYPTNPLFPSREALLEEGQARLLRHYD